MVELTVLMPITAVKLWPTDESEPSFVHEYLLQRLGELDTFEVYDVIENEVIGKYYAELARNKDSMFEYPREDVMCIRISNKDKEVRLFGYLRNDIIVLVHALVKKPHTRTPSVEVDLAEEKIKKILQNYGH